jgi:uncharacterized protein (TIGR02265 family)
MSSVKGSLFVYFVKAIRASKDGVYDPYLTDQDRQVLGGQILPSSWYPFETYKRCFRAVATVEAQNNKTAIRLWGREFCDEIMLSIYKRVLTDTTPMQSLHRYVSMFSMFYDFGELEVEARGANQAVLTIRGFDPDFEELYQLIHGWLERSLELTGARDVRVMLLTSSRGSAPETQFDLTWKS